MEAAGFRDVRLVNRNAWYVGIAREELAQLKGPLYEKAAAAFKQRALERFPLAQYFTGALTPSAPPDAAPGSGSPVEAK